MKEKINEPKQETLEEAMNQNGYHDRESNDLWREGVEFGANWQQGRMYTEQEVLQLLLRLQQTESYNNLYDWFEQFKKK